jgi:5'(3')-deoxyribonucleotidase
LIDDGIHNLEGGEFMKILFNHPHNRDYDAGANGMYRANDWQDVLNAIRIVSSLGGVAW